LLVALPLEDGPVGNSGEFGGSPAHYGPAAPSSWSSSSLPPACRACPRAPRWCRWPRWQAP